MAWRPFVVATLSALFGACSSPPTPPTAAVASSSPMSGPLPVRAEVVAEADRLAVAGAKTGGEKGAALTRRAAELRRRMWRLERREPDALEAIELFKNVVDEGGAAGCGAAIDSALLEGELRADPVKTYQAVYRIKTSQEACARRAESALTTLAAFKPLPNVLRELDREAGRDAGPVAVVSPPSPSTQVVRPKVSAKKQAGPVRITSIERYGSREAARIVVFISHPTLFDVGFLERQEDRGPRLYVDIEDAKYKGKLSFDVGGIVDRVRVGQRKGGTRVVLDLEDVVHRRVFYLPEPFRLVIDVSKTPPKPEMVDGGPRPIRRIVLDPGHGGHDPGAVGPGGLREKDVTLDVAHRAAPLIARELGLATLLTRDGDDYVALDERTARANHFNADLFISIHCNASENPEGNGIMTFVLDESRDALASSIAARENAASPAAAAELATVLSGTLDRATMARSYRLAELLQRSTRASMGPRYPGVRDRGVKRAGFYVLAGAQMPAALYEASFISNPTEEAFLDSPDFRQKLADSIVNAVRAFKEGK